MINLLKGLMATSLFLAASTAQADQCAWTDETQAQRNARVIEKFAGLTDENPAIYELCEICAGWPISEVDMGMIRYNLKKESDYNAAKDSVRTKFADLKTPQGLFTEKLYREVTLTLKDSETEVDIDAAYMYVETAPNVYTNLAFLSGCPFQGVSPQVVLDARVNDVRN